ncbi:MULTISPECIES: toll/interleukin-1 receptor domain-containing protein [Rhodomicrobium]|uniref:toll/interleukin-1 receptor domain-containing protein n=1 Tax=Rhodomicrobium TaxID=1068 RepID=UPI000B4C0A88|nr:MULTISPECIES: toll/interleukin-1 receptor domain-containing protein [Rhodomicrobium]
MPEIFISYCKQDSDHTEALAADLEARGYRTWWDTSLLPGDEFPELIKRRIDEADAVIVIWTPNSVKSRWVVAEAHRADNQGKLITVRSPGLIFSDIPMPFNTKHCEPVMNREKIYAALRERRVMANGASSVLMSTDDAAELYKRGDDFYYGRNGRSRDYRQAVAYFRKSADLAYGPAYNFLGWMYMEGQGVAQDDAEAVRLFRKAAEMGNAPGINNLGQMYQQGRGAARDDAEAVRLFRKAAELNNTYAICNLGYMYSEGRGVTRDDVEAARLFRKAADMGNAVASYNFADFHEHGRGVERSREDARHWYQRAADLGNAAAVEALKRF